MPPRSRARFIADHSFAMIRTCRPVKIRAVVVSTSYGGRPELRENRQSATFSLVLSHCPKSDADCVRTQLDEIKSELLP